MPDPEPDPESTRVIPKVQLRLADFVKGDPPLPRALLLVVGGDVRGAVLSVIECPATVGRGDADLVIDDPSVSRHHARITEEGESLIVEDAGSSNGTTINGNTVAGPMRLRDGDLVGFGSAIVLFKLIT